MTVRPQDMKKAIDDFEADESPSKFEECKNCTLKSFCNAVGLVQEHQRKDKTLRNVGKVREYVKVVVGLCEGNSKALSYALVSSLSKDRYS